MKGAYQALHDVYFGSSPVLARRPSDVSRDQGNVQGSSTCNVFPEITSIQWPT